VADLLQQGSQWLEGIRETHATRPVVYVRGTDSVEVSATVGRTVFRIDKGYGVMERVEARDYLVLGSALALNGQSILPNAGDRIREEADGKTFVYEVMAPGGEPCWRWSDPYRQTLRIHTKQVDVEGA
jgi:hypothetical protein